MINPMLIVDFLEKVVLVATKTVKYAAEQVIEAIEGSDESKNTKP